MGEMGSPHMGKRGAGDFTQKKNLISDIWEKWGRHIWGKGVLGITWTIESASFASSMTTSADEVEYCERERERDRIE